VTAAGTLSPSGAGLAARVERAQHGAGPLRMGKVTAALGLSVTVQGLDAAVGEVLTIHTDQGSAAAEVVAVGAQGLVCMPLASLHGLRTGALVTSTGGPMRIGVGRELRGRILDGLGQPLDGGPSIADLDQVDVENAAPNPLLRSRIDTPLGLGVRALDAMVPCGRGQRLGLFAGSGVGKSSLLSMVARGTEATISVVALVGERGREVREFIENDLGEEGLARSVVVVATSDQPPMVRLRAAFVATRIAEWFRDEGDDVVLMMDSLTRAAMAQREIGLSSGEPPATRGYPPSVFGMLPRLLERTGPGQRGSITGLYTVLVEGDDQNDPVGDSARSILDGHVWLSRRLATSGHFPSIDVLDSVSRSVGAITTPEQQADAITLRTLMSAHRDSRELIEIGAYVPGTNLDVDRARRLWPDIEAFLRQPIATRSTTDEAWGRLHALLETP
jgi:flagellum-specific ATP synthase